MSNIVLENWYELDFQIQNNLDDLLKVDEMMEELKTESLVSRWFFLWEGRTIRVRMKSDRRAELEKRLTELKEEKALILDAEHPFSEYKEQESSFFDEEVVESFAKIMSEVTQIAVKKAKREIQFGVYRVIERINHCVFNVIAGPGVDETQFLMQMTLERERIMTQIFMQAVLEQELSPLVAEVAAIKESLQDSCNGE